MNYLIERVENKKSYFSGHFDRLIITGNLQGRAYNMWGDDEEYEKYWGILFGNKQFPSLDERMEKYGWNLKKMVTEEFGEKGDPRRMEIWEHSFQLLSGETDDDMYEGVVGIFNMIFGGNWEFKKYYAWGTTKNWEYFIYDQYQYSPDNMREIACEYFRDFEEYNIYDIYDISHPFLSLEKECPAETIHVYPWENHIEKIKSLIDFNSAEDHLFLKKEIVAYKLEEI